IVMNKGDGCIINAANGSVISIIELAELIIELTGSNSKIIHQEPRPGDIKHSLADINELMKTEFRPKFDLEKGLKDTIEWFR
ncbi:MAG: dTDP-glucose 4,6-dehydratase, partial [Candidatus Methanoperedens sp.]|nr:dTDP-glucose 4,6-dehydratase [Candidatus Methanoperedens sp.]